MFSLVFDISLGSSESGAVDLVARLYDSTLTPVSAEITTGFVEVDTGNYIWLYDSFPDGFRGIVKFWRSGDTTVSAIRSVNPQEFENLDQKISKTLTDIFAKAIGDGTFEQAIRAIASAVASHMTETGGTTTLKDFLTDTTIGTAEVSEESRQVTWTGL